MGELEGWGVVEMSGRGLDRLHDRLPAVAGVDAIKTRGGVDDIAAVRRRKCIPRAEATSRGEARKARFAVNGSQKLSSSLGFISRVVMGTPNREDKLTADRAGSEEPGDRVPQLRYL